jgi:hypothetical protein
MAGLGDALPPESRSGLALFLRRGMWGWARTLAATGSQTTPLPATPENLAEPSGCSAFVQVLAAMVMNIDSRRAQ